LLRYCIKQRIAIVRYSLFGHDNFHSPQSRGGQVLAEIAAQHNRTARQVALNFLTRNPAVFIIPKANNPDHIQENSGGVGWKFTDSDIASIGRAFSVANRHAARIDIGQQYTIEQYIHVP
jgi:diketogulonate reductase-like aldo/keto reductase